MKPKVFDISTMPRLQHCCEAILPRTAEHKVWLLEGDLGVGKTTFVKKMTELLGSSEEVSSPTFPIVQEYESQNGLIIHFDLYRLDKEEDLIEIGFEEYLYRGAHIFIEWPLLATRYLGNYHHIAIQQSEKSRTLTYKQLDNNE